MEQPITRSSPITITTEEVESLLEEVIDHRVSQESDDEEYSTEEKKKKKKKLDSIKDAKIKKREKKQKAERKLEEAKQLQLNVTSKQLERLEIEEKEAVSKVSTIYHLFIILLFIIYRLNNYFKLPLVLVQTVDQLSTKIKTVTSVLHARGCSDI